MLRVRQITDPLVPNTTKIIKDGLLPSNIEQILSSKKTVRYPPFVYTLKKKYGWAFSHFGIFTEHLIRAMLKHEWKDNIYKLYLETSHLYTDDDISETVSKKDIYDSMGRFVNISKYVADDLDDKKILYDQEYIHDVVMGHPDLVTVGVSEIYDIKTTTKFESISMKNGTLLQLCAYLALARASGYNPKKIGVVLPFQQRTLTYDLEVTEYDHQPFLSLLLQVAKPCIYTIQEKAELTLLLPVIGAHTHKIGGSVYKSLLDFYSNGIYTRPCQIFMRGNRGARSIKLKDKDIAETVSFIYQHKIKYFTHSPYTINLCHPCGRKTLDKDPCPWATNILQEDLELTNVTDGCGVVVHTGKAMELSEKDAYDQMYYSILSVLDAATERCPLLLETPCDKGTELCGTLETLAEFYLRFTIEQRKRFKICVDTCHVFAAGYQPYEYLSTFSTLTGAESIGLIHLNDAQWAKGSSHDGHAWIGRGCIGMTEMLKTIRWCVDRNIPMVHE